MNLYQKFSISIVIASLLLCGNAFAKQAPPTVDVNVVNTPLDVKVVDGASSQPLNFCKELIVGDLATHDFYEVPIDQRLVIEYTSFALIGVLSADEVMQATLHATANGTAGQFHVGGIRGDTFVFDGEGRLVKIHADAGTTVKVSFAFPGTLADDDVRICFSGQLSPDS